MEKSVFKVFNVFFILNKFQHQKREGENTRNQLQFLLSPNGIFVDASTPNITVTV